MQGLWILANMSTTFISIPQNTGGITFGDFMDFLSVISKGTTQEKIIWSFDFFDIDRNGYIDRQEMAKVCSDSLEFSRIKPV